LNPRAIALLALLAGCGDDGSVVLQLDLPDDPALDPFGDRVVEMTLTGEVDGEELFSASRPVAEGEPLDFGRVPIAEQVSFALRGVDGSGRTIAFGRGAAPVDVTAGAEVTVPIRVRRPFAYVSGGDALLAIDATLGPGEAYASTIAVPGPITSTAMSADGSEILVTGADGMQLIPTATHVAEPGVAALNGPVVDLAVSPDGHWAVTSHLEPEFGISVVDLDALRAGDPVAAEFIPTLRPGNVAIGGGLIWVMQEPQNAFTCAGESSLLPLPLDDPGAALPAVSLNGLATDLVADPVTGTAIAVRACVGQVLRVNAPDSAAQLFAEVEGATSVAIARDRVWIMGHRDGEGAHLNLASLPLFGAGEMTLRDLPTLEERATALQLEQTGQGGLVQVTADGSAASDIVVLPDGEHVAMLVAAIYDTEPSGDAGGGQPILPGIFMVTYEYQLVELATGLGAQRLRTTCSLSWETGALLDDFACALAPGQDQTAASFTPTDLAVIYGAR
jgi:hypothetical protein